ncbi:hypothetical protein D3C86_1289160 [compost metagenome]
MARIECLREVRVIIEAERRVARVITRFDDRLTAIAHIQLRQGLSFGLNALGDRSQQFRTLCTRGVAPTGIQRFFSGRDSRIDIFGSAARDLGEGLFGSRINDGQGLASSARRPATFNKVQVLHVGFLPADSSRHLTDHAEIFRPPARSS